MAYTTYDVHLGDFSKENNYDFNNYDVHRNYAYTYNITIADVDKIVVEAQRDEDEQPGTEGLVFELKGAREFNLDAHYEYCVMKFNQQDIKNLLQNNKGGYAYTMQVLGKSTGPIIVSASGATGQNGVAIADAAASYNGVNLRWIEFCKGGTYNNKNIGRGEPVAYPGVGSSKLSP